MLTVTETPEGIRVRQDRFLETGKGKGPDNETIWSVHVIPLCNMILMKEIQERPPAYPYH